MKRLLPIIATCMYCVVGFAQPTLLSSNTSPAGGEVYLRHTCGVSHVDPGLAGSAVSWNFAGLSTISVDTVFYLACPAAGACDSFATSSVAGIVGGSYSFYFSDTSEFSLAGTSPSGGNVYFTDPQARLVYPFAYGSAARDSFARTRPAFNQYGYGVDSLMGDAYGTLILPSGTYDNVLRVHTISITADSSFSGITTIVDSYRTDLYSWYMPGFHNPLLSMYYDFVTLTGTPELAQVFYYATPPSSAPSLGAGQQRMKAYPLPAKDRLTLEFDSPLAGNADIQMLDISGHVVYRSSCLLQQGSSLIQMAVHDIARGIYWLRVVLPGGSGYRFVKIPVE